MARGKKDELVADAAEPTAPPVLTFDDEFEGAVSDETSFEGFFDEKLYREGEAIRFQVIGSLLKPRKGDFPPAIVAVCRALGPVKVIPSKTSGREPEYQIQVASNKGLQEVGIIVLQNGEQFALQVKAAIQSLAFHFDRLGDLGPEVQLTIGKVIEIGVGRIMHDTKHLVRNPKSMRSETLKPGEIPGGKRIPASRLPRPPAMNRSLDLDSFFEEESADTGSELDALESQES